MNNDTSEKKPTTKKTKSKKSKKTKDVDDSNKTQKKKEKNTTKKYINALLAKAEKELFKTNPTSSTSSSSSSSSQPSTQPEQKRRKRQKHKKITDNNKICHYFLKKGTDIIINEYDYFPIQKVKKQANILSKLNLNIKIGGIFKNKKKNVKYTDYYLFIDEYFIYFCKDVAVFTNDEDKRRIGSAVSLFNVTSIICEKEEENNMFKIELDIKLRKNSKVKEFYITMDNYSDLIAEFKEIKKEYDLNYKIEQK